MIRPLILAAASIPCRLITSAPVDRLTVMGDSPDTSRKLRTFADDIQKRDQWLKTWFLIFSGLAALNVILIVISSLTSSPPWSEPSWFYVVLFGSFAAFFAYQRRQLNKFKSKNCDVVQVLGEEGLPQVRYTNAVLILAVSQGVTQIELSTARPLEPLSFDNGVTWIEPVPLVDVVRRLKKLCGHTSTSTGPTFLKVNAMKKHCIVTCTFRDADDYASIAITPDPTVPTTPDPEK